MTIRWALTAAPPHNPRTATRAGLLAMLLAISACGEGAAPAPSAADIRQAESLRPASAELRAKYERACMACHTSIDAKAPLTGAVAQWKPRLDKGMDLLARHAMEGFNAMPPKGLCMDCSEADMRALIVFMSQGKDEPK
ncbi:c-type cytochrome [Variovorax sp. VaC1]|uniref:c-type cytochrome n=1 Tax=Variovorax sp. VaC1 TaxID=3373132 RepID=UPI003749EF1C